MSIGEEFSTVLESSKMFSTSATPAMLTREQALDRARARLQRWIAGRQREPALSVARGGRQSNFSPVAWLRVFDPLHSPRATEGFYLAYLFSADGSAVWLCLMQGTSEFRANKMRPISDRQLLMRRSAEGRQALREHETTPILACATISVDLRWRTAGSVGAESRRRIRNYEDATLYAIRYGADALPVDDVILSDLADFLHLLEMLYAVDARATRDQPALRENPQRPANGPGLSSRAQGRLMDSAMRRALELYAEDAAISLLRDWTCTRVGALKLGYDLLCQRGERMLHLEVKGTTTLGEEVILTPGEVRHQSDPSCSAEHGLFVLADVTVRFEEGAYHCGGGTARLLRPWDLDQTMLTPTEYVYRVPAQATGDVNAPEGKSSPFGDSTVDGVLDSIHRAPL